MNLLAFFAHPDDETILCGGILALLARHGVRIHFLSATRGEGGEMGEPPLSTRARLGEMRAQELHCAIQALGGASLQFLDYVDPTIGADNQLFPYTEDIEGLASQLSEHIQGVSADVLLSHGSNGEYGHPAHLVSYQAAKRAVEMLGDAAPVFYTASASFPDHPRPFLTNQDDPADLVIDISPAREQKLLAALCHRTQHALFVRKGSEEAGRPVTIPEVIITVEGLRRVTPARNGGHDDPVGRVLRPHLYTGDAQV